MAIIFRESMQGIMKSKSKTNINDKLSNILEAGIEKQTSKN